MIILLQRRADTGQGQVLWEDYSVSEGYSVDLVKTRLMEVGAIGTYRVVGTHFKGESFVNTFQINQSDAYNATDIPDFKPPGKKPGSSCS